MTYLPVLSVSEDPRDDKIDVVLVHLTHCGHNLVVVTDLKEFFHLQISFQQVAHSLSHLPPDSVFVKVAQLHERPDCELGDVFLLDVHRG